MKLFRTLVFVAIVVACQAWTSDKQFDELDQNQSNVEEQMQKFLSSWTRRSGINEPSVSWDNYAASIPEAAPFHGKITERVEKSSSLENKPKVKQSVIKIATEKLNACKSLSFKPDTVDRSCLGRITGQMMQLIAAVENVDRQLPGQTW